MATRSWSTRTGGLKSEVARLRDKIIDVELDSRVERAALKVLCQQVGTDPETFKKRAWLEIAKEAIGDNRDRVQRAVCRKLGKSRQAYRQGHRARKSRQVDQAYVIDAVFRVRAELPMTGGRKLYAELKGQFKAAGVRCGRDKLFKVLRDADLLVKRRKPYAPHTTQQDKSLPVSPNLVKDMVVDKPNKVVISDITYIRCGDGFLYLALVADKGAKDIVGWDLGDHPDAAGCIRAAKMAHRALPKGLELIHHSDRGSTYACHDYRELLDSFGWKSSMTEVLHCYENSVAERINGILKQEFYLDQHFVSKAAALAAVREAIRLYNKRRRHEALGYITPYEFRLRNAA